MELAARAADAGAVVVAVMMMVGAGEGGVDGGKGLL